MKQVLGVNLLPEMAGLWLVETGLCLLGFHLVLPGGDLALAQAMLLALTVGLVGFALGLYRPATCLEMRRLLLSTGLGAAVSLPVILAVAALCGIVPGSRAMLPLCAGALVGWASLLLVMRLLYRMALSLDLLTRRVAIVGAPAATARVGAMIGDRRRGLYRVEMVRSTALAAERRGLWGVVITDGETDAAALPRRVRRFDAASFWENQLGRVDPEIAAREPVFAAAGESRLSAVLRRGFDIAAASALLALTAPLLAVTALAIRLESPGPVIYRQERVGLGGRSFTVLKFRSMRQDAERGTPVWASVGDARVTRLGRVLRKLRIDELPQLVNVLRGEMSMVGPRPERPHFVAQLAAVIPMYAERALVKPGLTGWAQVSYPYGASVEDARAKLTYDLYYVKHRSLAFDLTILLATVRVILFQEGAR